MLNNANAMEIDEIKNNDGVDAIMEIGFQEVMDSMVWQISFPEKQIRPVI